jgi:hypothetical protein
MAAVSLLARKVENRGGEFVNPPQFEPVLIFCFFCCRRPVPSVLGTEQGGGFLSSFPASAINVQHYSLLAPSVALGAIQVRNLTVHLT